MKKFLVVLIGCTSIAVSQSRFILILIGWTNFPSNLIGLGGKLDVHLKRNLSIKIRIFCNGLGSSKQWLILAHLGGYISKITLAPPYRVIP